MPANPPQLIVALGNPGSEYEKTRHNIGFMVVDALHSSGWKKRFQSEYQQDESGCHWLKPQTYMNLSGQAVKACAQACNVEINAILVVHDELDFPAGRVQLKSGGGAGGHNGLTSIIENLGDNSFWRLRIGIGKPEAGLKPGEGADYVLNKMPKLELKLASEAALEALRVIKELGLVAAQQAINRQSGSALAKSGS